MEQPGELTACCARALLQCTRLGDFLCPGCTALPVTREVTSLKL